MGVEASADKPEGGPRRPIEVVHEIARWESLERVQGEVLGEIVRTSTIEHAKGRQRQLGRAAMSPILMTREQCHDRRHCCGHVVRRSCLVVRVEGGPGME